MTMFFLKRFLGLIITLWMVFTIAFVLMRFAKGSPFESDRKMEPEMRKNMEERYHLNGSKWEQYTYEIGNYLRGDLGYSIKSADTRVNQIISESWLTTLKLGILALSLAIVFGILAGIYAAMNRGTWIDSLIMAFATIGIALPSFVIASWATYIFVFQYRIFPAGGISAGNVKEWVLPVVCLSLPYTAYIARLTRTGMLEVLNQDYIRTAHAKGLSTNAVIFRHALRGAILPVVSYLGPATAGILTGSLVIESIFAIPGLGTHFVQAALQKDWTLCMGLVMLYTLVLYLLNVVVDIAYTILDPRVKLD